MKRPKVPVNREEQMTSFTRRKTLGLLSATAAVAACAGTGERYRAGTESAALKDLAGEKGIRFGSAMSARQLRDQKYVDLVLKDCAVIVAENEHKMYVINRTPNVMNWAPADALVEFSRANGLGMRGHTLVWQHANWLPDWVNETEFASASEAEDMLGNYVGRVAARYADAVYSWDVVNEAIDPATGELRDTSLSRAMGPEIMDFCFHKAREADPDAKLAYNDYMSWESGHEKHRAGVLRMLERLKANGAPIDALGIQSHSNDNNPAEFTAEKQRAWRAFVEEAIGMGLEIYLTEFDVNDTNMVASVTQRDVEIAAFTKDYLDIMLSYPETKDVLMWGVVDSQSWLQNFKLREDGIEKRPTLYDSSYRPKLMRDAVAAAFRAAPAR